MAVVRVPTVAFRARVLMAAYMAVVIGCLASLPEGAHQSRVRRAREQDALERRQGGPAEFGRVLALNAARVPPLRLDDFTCGGPRRGFRTVVGRVTNMTRRPLRGLTAIAIWTSPERTIDTEAAPVSVRELSPDETSSLRVVIRAQSDMRECFVAFKQGGTILPTHIEREIYCY